MDRTEFFFKQPVTEDEMNEAFSQAEVAIRNLTIDQNLFGVQSGLVLAQKLVTPDLTITASQGVAYDQAGERMANNAPTEAINCAVDFNAVSTAVSGVGNQKYLSIFLGFQRSNSVPRVDGNGDTIYFQQAEGHVYVVVQGTEAPAGTANRPTLDPDRILLGDVLLSYAETAITNGTIDTTRRQDAFVVTSTPYSLRAGTFAGALTSLLGSINGVSASVAYGGGDNWADGTTNPATTVNSQLSKIIDDLKSTVASSGAQKIGARLQTSGSVTLAAGTLDSQLLTLAAGIASAGSAAGIPYTLSGTWANGAQYWAETTWSNMNNAQKALDSLFTLAKSLSTGTSGLDQVGAAPMTGLSYPKIGTSSGSAGLQMALVGQELNAVRFFYEALGSGAMGAIASPVDGQYCVLTSTPSSGIFVPSGLYRYCANYSGAILNGYMAISTASGATGYWVNVLYLSQTNGATTTAALRWTVPPANYRFSSFNFSAGNGNSPSSSAYETLCNGTDNAVHGSTTIVTSVGTLAVGDIIEGVCKFNTTCGGTTSPENYVFVVQVSEDGGTTWTAITGTDTWVAGASFQAISIPFAFTATTAAAHSVRLAAASSGAAANTIALNGKGSLIGHVTRP